MRAVAFLVSAVAAVCALGADPVAPTPNPATFGGGAPAAFVQPTESGLTESGLYGCVRTGGRQFHEGLDLFPLQRDKRGEPADPVFAILPGTVAYFNAKAGASNYGRYVVVEHTAESPAVISLYAHLQSVAPDLRIGQPVHAGQTLGLMGRSAATSIPRERGHLHLETGLWLSRRFQTWYDAKKFPTRNEHGVFNGMNVVAFDILDYVERKRAGDVRGLADYLVRQPTAATIVVRSTETPDFVRRYPEFLRADVPAAGVAGWRIEFAWFGLPKAWWPLDAIEMAAARGGPEEIVFHDEALLDRFPCQGVIRIRKGRVEPGPRLRDTLDIVFQGGP